ncbi:MAG TPA: hypothetical protein VK986_20970, partial [Tepidisphaeraceae bacterium]|nr:hypothetical protein [Tepidisphaeraceae bacterium]
MADRTFLYPHLCHALPFSPGCDAQTPYGYGGPLFAGEWSADDRRTALIDLAGALRARGAIAEFVRCHPEWCDPGTLAAAGYTTFQVRTNVECDLTGDDFTATWVASARRNLRKAQSSGLTFRVASSPHLPTPSSPCPVDLDTF